MRSVVLPGLCGLLIAGCGSTSTGPSVASYSFVQDTTIGGGLRYYTVAITPGGVAFLTRPDAAKLARFDLTSLALDTGFAAAGAQANGVTLDATGSTAYIANQSAQTLGVVRTSTGVGEAPTPVSGDPYQTLVSASGADVLLSGSTDSLQVFTIGRVFVRKIQVASAPFGLARRSNGEILVTHLGSGGVWKVNAALTGAALLRMLPVAAANGIAVSPTSGAVFIASETGNVVFKLDPSTGDSLGAVNLPHPWGVSLTPDGSEVWVTSTAGNVYALSASTLAVRDSIVLGGTPRGIAIDSRGKGAVIANENGTLTLIR